MSYSSVFHHTNKQYTLEELEQSRERNKEVYASLKERHPKFAEKAYPIDNVQYVVLLSHTSFLYVDMVIEGVDGENINTPEIALAQFERQNQQVITDVLAKKNYGTYLPMYLYTQTIALYTLRVGEELIAAGKLADAQKLWRSAHQYMEYGHELLAPLFTRVKEYLPAPSLVPPFKIYRGATGKSTPHEQLTSWSTEKAVALRFALHHAGDNSDLYLYEATVEEGMVFTHFENDEDAIRNEYEVLLEGHQLRDVQVTHVEGLQRFISVLNERIPEWGIAPLAIYGDFARAINPKWFQSPELHGVLHAKRVCLFALSLARLQKRSLDDAFVLAVAAMHHERGRRLGQTDGQYAKSSERAFKQSNDKLKVLLGAGDIAIAAFLIRHQCATPAEIQSALDTATGIDKERAWALYQIFADAEKLDTQEVENITIQSMGRFHSSYAWLLTQHARQFAQHVQ